MDNAQIIPFYFRELPESSGKYIITNQSGAFSHVDYRSHLEGIVGHNFENISNDKIDELIANNFLTFDGDYQERLNRLASVYASRVQMALEPPSLFMIVPTLRCDHDCGYCQVSRVPVDKNGYDLDANHIERIVDIIGNISTNNPKIEFQGGEPLLAFEFIQKFVECASQKLKDKNPSFVICSALGSLSEEILEWSASNNVLFSVSLDGPEHVHNKNRPSKHFTPFKTVLKNLDILRMRLGEDKISCLSTITNYSLKYPVEIVNTYFDLDLEGIFIRPLSPFGFASYNKKLGYSAEEYFSFHKKALDRIIELNSKRKFVEETTLFHWKRIFRPNDMGYVDLKSPAGHVFGSMMFNYDGHIFGSDEARMLWESTKAPELVLGSVKDSPEEFLLKDENIALLSQTFIAATPGCDECAYQPYCGSDPMHHLATCGDPIGDKSKSFFCQFERNIFDYLFTLLGDNKTSVLDQWLRH